MVGFMEKSKLNLQNVEIGCSIGAAAFSSHWRMAFDEMWLIASQYKPVLTSFLSPQQRAEVVSFASYIGTLDIKNIPKDYICSTIVACEDLEQFFFNWFVLTHNTKSLNLFCSGGVPDKAFNLRRHHHHCQSSLVSQGLSSVCCSITLQGPSRGDVCRWLRCEQRLFRRV